MKKLLLSLSLVCTTLMSQAQIPATGYVFSNTTSTYTPLSGGTDANGGDIWILNSLSVPAGFSYKLGPDTLDHVSILQASLGPATDTFATGVFNAFNCMGSLWLMDRAIFDTVDTAESPVTYLTEGTAPNRIFKMEYKNAGIIQEAIYLDSMAGITPLQDYVNLQIWVYETTNVIEFHYGASHLSYPSAYFPNGATIAYLKNLDPMGGTIDVLLYLTGNPATPGVDSTDDVTVTPAFLDSYPANGTVYRFTPQASTTGFSDPTLAKLINVYPSVTSTTLSVRSQTAGALQYEVISVNGQQLNINGTLQPGKSSVDVSTLPAGIYLLQLSSGQGLATYRFVKQ